MSDFLNKFKSIFVVEDANATPAKTTEKSADKTASPTVTPAQSTTYTPAAPIYSPPMTGVLNEKFVEILTKSLEASNQDGFDFFEFRESLKSLSKMPMDDKTRYQSAFAMASTMGATPQKLLASAQFYLDVLKNEDKKFSEAVGQQRSKLIGNKEQESQQLEGAIQQKAEQIKQMTQEIESHQNRIEQLKQEITDATGKVESTATDFTNTYQTVVAQIQNDIQKMQEYSR
jgi:DNA repair exonuclease SbcCD ATPase subunit